jgi:methyl-accepting chemotaxis protein
MGGEEMTTLLLSIITLTCVVLVIVLIYVLLELRQATQKLEQFITTSETSLKPTFDELPGTIRSIRHFAENIATVTDDVKTLSGSVREVGENIRLTSGYIEEIASSSSVQVSGLRAGIRAGFNVLVNNLLTKHKK